MIVIRVNYASAVPLWPNENTPGLSWTGQIHLLDLVWIWRYEVFCLILFASVLGVFLGLAMGGENSAPRSRRETIRFSFLRPEKPIEENAGSFGSTRFHNRIRGLTERQFHGDIIEDSDAESS